MLNATVILIPAAALALAVALASLLRSRRATVPAAPTEAERPGRPEDDG